jgi:NADH-quinone oxidoreductase subunit E
MLGMFKAMRTTIRHLPTRKLTVQYPEQREELPERSRGLFRVVVDPLSGDARCRACTLCETNCPVQVIRVEHTSRYDLPAPNLARLSRARLGAQPSDDLELLRPVIDDYHEHGTGLIGVLQNTQDAYRYLPRRALEEIALHTGVSLAQIYGVASFYNQFRLSPTGDYIVEVCHGTACHVAGSAKISEALQEELGVPEGKTTADMKFTLTSVACMGACSQAPVMRIGENTYGGLTPDKTRRIMRILKSDIGVEEG